MNTTLRPTPLAALFALALALPAAAQQELPPPPREEAPMSHALAALDQKLIGESLRAGQLQIEAARLAPSRSSNPELLSLAADIDRDQSALNARMESIMGGVRPFPEPSTMSGAQHTNPESDTARVPDPAPSAALVPTELSALAALNGAEFDTQWAVLMVASQNAAIERFRNGSEGGGAEVRPLSIDALVIIRRHMRSLDDLALATR